MCLNKQIKANYFLTHVLFDAVGLEVPTHDLAGEGEGLPAPGEDGAILSPHVSVTKFLFRAGPCLRHGRSNVFDEVRCIAQGG